MCTDVYMYCECLYIHAFTTLPFIHIHLCISFSIFEEHLFIYWVNWRIMALQCCVSFRCTAAWRSHKYISSSSGAPPILLLWVSTEHGAELPLLYWNFPLASYFIHGHVHMPICPSSLSPTVPAISILFKFILLHGCVIDCFTSVLLQLGT